MPNLGVGTNRSILEILHIFLRLNNLSRLDLEPDLLLYGFPYALFTASCELAQNARVKPIKQNLTGIIS
jgi:hypothetical protein